MVYCPRSLAENQTTHCFIYVIRNTVNDKVYVGQTWKNLQFRFMSHCRIGPHNHCVKIARAIAKYGKDNFFIHCLMICHTQEIADYWENFFIKKFDSIDNGYNLLEFGFSRRGTKHTNETLEKMSISQSGSKNGRAILTDVQVANIRKEYDAYWMPNHIKRPKYGACTTLARKYGVSVSCIKDIIYGNNWK
jgi:group I intron endonuclease